MVCGTLDTWLDVHGAQVRDSECVCIRMYVYVRMYVCMYVHSSHGVGAFLCCQFMCHQLYC